MVHLLIRRFELVINQQEDAKPKTCAETAELNFAIPRI